MSNTFSTTKLSGQRVLVTGVDFRNEARQTVLDSSQYEHLLEHEVQDKAEAEFGAAVDAFFAPITDAAAAAEAKLNSKVEDDAFHIVVSEAVEGVPAQREVRVVLHQHTAVLRLIASGDTSRLIWIGDTIEILAPVEPAPVLEPEVPMTEEEIVDANVKRFGADVPAANPVADQS